MNYKTVTPEEAVKVIKSGDRVHLSSVAVTPHCLIRAMVERGKNKEFKDVKIQHIHTEGPAPYADAEFEGTFFLESFLLEAM
jgi:acyl-CoA hydrolase